MKEYGEGVITKAQADYRKWKEHLIDKEGDYVCSIPACNKIWYPTDADINRKRPSCYYKLCSACRLKSFLKGREYKQKKGNNYDANNQTNAEEVRYEQ